MPQHGEKPMMTQYKRIKEQYLDGILMFRVGGFFQMYYNDAQTVHDVLGMKLISRNAGYNIMIPMCGIPAGAVSYRAQQLSAVGYRVAVCDQIPDEMDSELGISARRVIKVYEPDGRKIDLTDVWTKYMAEHTFEPQPKAMRQIKTEDILKELKNINFENTTPAEAFRILYGWKRKYCPEERIG